MGKLKVYISFPNPDPGADKWTRIYTKCRDIWIGLCKKYGRSLDEAEEIIQRVMCKVMDREASGKFIYNSDEAASAYIAKSIKREIFNAGKPSKVSFEEKESLEMYLSDDLNPEEALLACEDEENQKRIKDCLFATFRTDLNDIEREVVTLLFIKNKKYREVSEMLGYSIPRIQKYRNSALAKIARKIHGLRN